MEKRRSLSAPQRARAAMQLARRFFEAFHIPPHMIIAAYRAIGHEIDALPILSALAQRGYKCALPVTGENGHMVFREWEPHIPQKRGKYGIWEPPDSATQITPNIVLTPVVGFDDKGNRLGRGGGYYDRALAGLRAQGGCYVIGLAHHTQRLIECPHEAHDQKLDAIVTDRDIIMLNFL